MDLRALFRSSDAAFPAAAILLAVLLAIANHIYLSNRWTVDLFTSNEGNLTALALMIVLVGLTSTFIPKRFDTPGGTLVVFLFAFVYVPTVSISLSQVGWVGYIPELLALTVAMSVPALVATRMPLRQGTTVKLPASLFWVLLGAWTLVTGYLLFEYGDIISFVGIHGTYDQREVGRATSTLMAYSQTYYLNVFCPGLLAYALVEPRRRWVAVLAVVGFAIIYGVNAQKMAVIIPVMMIGVAVLIRLAQKRSVVLFLLGISAACLIALTHIWLVAGNNSLIAAVVLHRAFGIPAMTLHWYLETFDATGYTLWSHVRGISLIVSPPDDLAVDPLWPNLGFIIGDRVLGNPINNVNANLFSSDGAAGGGLFGIVLIGLGLSAWVAVVNFVSRGWNAAFLVLVTVPVALTLSNGPMFTTLLSFGGLFWVAAFAAYSGVLRFTKSARQVA